jgi:aspartate/methionine/tyrosine aminotransferase
VGYTGRSLLEAGVSIAPGSIYGDDGRGYVRLSLSIADDTLDEALDRLKRLWQAG